MPHCKPTPVMKKGFFPTGKNLVSSPGNPVMKTGFSLCGKSTQGKPCSGPVLALYGIAVWEIKVFCSEELFGTFWSKYLLRLSHL